MRRLLLSVVLGTLGSAALAGPPKGPLPEGRETDPVAREFHSGLAPTPPTGTDDPVRTPTGPSRSHTIPLVPICAVLCALLEGVALPHGPLATSGK
jgi:hypothetical protein